VVPVLSAIALTKIVWSHHPGRRRRLIVAVRPVIKTTADVVEPQELAAFAQRQSSGLEYPISRAEDICHYLTRNIALIVGWNVQT
jgi:hypothetical protein